MRTLPALLLAAALLAGCASSSGDGANADPSAILGDERIGGPQPVLAKDTLQASPPPLLPVMPAQPAMTFEVGADGSRVHLAYDLDGTSGPQVLVRVVFADGSAIETGTTDPGKRVRIVDDAAAGTANVYVESTAAWTVGAVITVFPPGFDEGERVQVSTPEQTQIEHKFVPGTVTVAAGAPSRLTLYDYDPHAGIENLQHNIHFPGLDLRTMGKTTWGEVRVLDLPPLAAGAYQFECEFHGFTATLQVE